jgi:hypothetical protein
MKAVAATGKTTISLVAVVGVALVALLSGALIYGQTVGVSSVASSTSTQSSVTSSSSPSAPSSNLTITGKVMIVICKEPVIVNASQCNGPPDVYSSRQLTLTPAPGSSFDLALAQDGSFVGQVPAGNYQVGITPCDFLGCSLPKPMNITVAADLDRNYSICFNC